ncbi:MAG: SPFH domain-containing protein, partial [Ruminococcus sp.]|nr:SPFH domain-containing protein [Ruminococcus sp.]
MVCPACGFAIASAAAELGKADASNDLGINVIKYEGDNSTFVWKHPVTDFNMGTMLIVHESQEAVFFSGGQILDTFGPGRHVLKTENIP